jgi:O-acetyl-ADP-ribose deacetylase (regulator of RNase III)
MECIFIDLNNNFIETMKKICDESQHDLSFITCKCGDVKKEPIENTVFVSPANEIGFMDGGIDRVYNEEMFPKIEHLVKTKIKTVDIKTTLGRYCLPVGSAIITTAIPETHTYLITAPTMFLPHDVSGTNNAYNAFMACLCVLKKFNNDNIHRLVSPGLCLGWGKMKPHVAAEQIINAIVDFKNMRNIPHQIKLFDDKNAYITEDKHDEQPNYYDNLEIKEIEISDIIYKH